jgi:hypothetical protein
MTSCGEKGIKYGERCEGKGRKRTKMGKRNEKGNDYVNG